MITVVADGVTRLADNDFGDNLGDGVAGPVGLLIVVLLAIATALLIRNMNSRLKRLPASFGDPEGVDGNGAEVTGPEVNSVPASESLMHSTDDRPSQPDSVEANDGQPGSGTFA